MLYQRKKINEINDTFSKSDEMKNVLSHKKEEKLPHKGNKIKENSLKQENFFSYIHLCMKNFSSILIQSHQENNERKKENKSFKTFLLATAPFSSTRVCRIFTMIQVCILSI